MFGMPTYVISLKGRGDRRKTFDDNWKSYDYEYVDAIDGDDLDIKKLIQDGVINDYFLSPGYFIGTRAVYGVALTQKKCWEKFLLGFKFWSNWGSGQKKSKTPSRANYLIILKVDLKISPLLMRPVYEKISIFDFCACINF